jgi:hypothetical protein
VHQAWISFGASPLISLAHDQTKLTPVSCEAGFDLSGMSYLNSDKEKSGLAASHFQHWLEDVYRT